jgi:3'-phosphoadenosine 5'-phosphosulfate (PAPS) 3'-phosphatase
MQRSRAPSRCPLTQKAYLAVPGSGAKKREKKEEERKNRMMIIWTMPWREKE